MDTVREKILRSAVFATPERIAGVAVAGVVLLQLLAVTIYNDFRRPVFELGFSFDPYLKSLYEGKGYVGCEDFGCNRASRMPAVPYFLYALTTFTLKYKVTAYIKVLLLGVLTWPAARIFAREVKPTTPFAVGAVLVITLFLVFSPNLIKHMSAMHYEEGYLIAIVAIATMLTFALLLRGPERFSGTIAAMAVLAGAVSYLVKSSQVAVLAAITMIVVALAFRAGRRGVAAGLVALALAAPLAWATHNQTMTGRFSFMSSYDGENLFRGFNVNTLVVYPHCGTDVLFSGSDTCQGRKMNLPKEQGRSGFPDEWAWNDAYKARAYDFIREQPVLALKTLGVKFLTVTAWPRLVPHVLEGDDGRERWRSPVEEIIGGAWLTVGRIIELFGLGLAIVLFARGDGRARAIAAASLLLAGSYAAPYIVGFGMERHFSIFILICAFSTLVLATEWQRLRKGSPAQRAGPRS